MKLGDGAGMITGLLTGFPGIGPARGRNELAGRLAESGHPARLAAALVRVSLTRNTPQE